MKYYCEIISVSLAEKLKEKGMPIHIWRDMFSDNKGTDATFASVFDWLMDRGLSCEITRHIDFGHEEVCPEWDWDIERVGPIIDSPGGYAGTWHEAAEAAIEKALTLI